MSPRQHLHELVDALPDDNLPAAQRLMAALREPLEVPTSSFDTAPVDEEPETEAERDAVAAALREIRKGAGIPHDDVRRRLGAA